MLADVPRRFPPDRAPLEPDGPRRRARVRRASWESGGTLPVWLILLNLKIRKPANQRELAEAVGACEATLTHHPNAMDARGAGMNRAPDRLCRMVVVVLCVRVICTLAENDVAGAPLQGSEESRVENRPGYRTVRTRIQPL
jgi:hypothetical protein